MKLNDKQTKKTMSILGVLFFFYIFSFFLGSNYNSKNIFIKLKIKIFC